MDPTVAREALYIWLSNLREEGWEPSPREVADYAFELFTKGPR
jgi:hypothetical protein